MSISTENYLPAEIAITFPDKYSREYWRRAAAGELSFQRCADCQTFRHPAGPMCPNCGSFADEWFAVAGTGTVYSFTIVTHPVHPALVDVVPFNIVLVEFPDAPGVRLVTNLVDVPPDEITMGMTVDVIYQKTPAMTLPRVKRATA
jgi:uncharacterized OB-fold protein